MHNWDDFRYFWAVVNCGSYSVAARELGVNHSTVSRRIQAFEQAHGVRLLERTQSGYQMTEAGTSIYDIVAQLNEQSNKASRVLQGQDARLEGHIKLTMPHDIFEFILAKPLNAFNQQHPKILLSLLVNYGLKNMANREADLAVRVTATPPEYLVGSRITTIQHGLYAGKDFRLPLANSSEATPIILWNNVDTIPDWAHQHLPNPYVALVVDDLLSMHQAVAVGFGVARMPCFLPDVIASKSVKRLPIILPRSDWGIWILNHEDLRRSAKINYCRRFLKEALTDKIPLFTGELSMNVFD